MDVETPSKAGASSMVPVAIGLIGVVLGGAALLIALNLRSAASQTSANLSNEVANVTIQLKSIQGQLQALDTKVNSQAETVSGMSNASASVAASVKTVSNDVKALQTAAQDKLTQLFTMITEDRALIKAQGDGLQQIVTRLTPPTPAASSTTAAAGTSSAAAAGPTAPAGGAVHTVASGEFLGTIAKKYGVTVEAIEAANPGLNPNRMQIGAKLVIPAPVPKPAAGSTPAPAP